MAELSRRASRHKIEPLNYAEMASAPALKGGISFLEVSAADVRSGNFDGFGPQPVPSSEVGIYPGDETAPAPVSTRRSTVPRSSQSPKHIAVTPTGAKATSRVEAYPAVETPPVPVLIPEDEKTPGDETASRYDSTSLSADLTPGRGRSKIRRCVLAQDGHSLGEEAIYQALWRTGRPESGDPNGSRTNRVGAAELGYKVNMAKKNVRQNISRLFEKLALEIVEDFETMNSQARLYRVFSYKQILERRRASGLEYVLRNKGVVFCSADGRELVSSPAYVSTPGDETPIRPAPPKRSRKRPGAIEPPKYEQTESPADPEESESADLKLVSKALNQFFSVDQDAAVQLIRKCRRVREDARADEIAFFVAEKLDLARSSRNITNPVGLILATVPQSFVGSTFVEFRNRMERSRALAAEEAARKDREQAEMKAYIQRQREIWEATVSDPTKSEKERDAAERSLRQFAPWD
jgi:hypothetical protein